MYLQTIPFDPEVIPFVYFIIITAIIVTFLYLRLLYRYRKREKPLIRALMFNTLSWAVGTWAYSIGLISWYYIDDRTWLYDISIPIGYISILISTYFVLKLATNLLDYDKKKKNLVLNGYKIYMLIMIVLFSLPQNNWGILPPIPTFRMVNLVLLILGNIIVYSVLIKLFRDLRGRVNDAFQKKKLFYVLVFFELMLATFLLMVGNEIFLMFLSDPPPYGILEYLAWTCGILGLIVGYLALILPDRFKYWIKKREKQKQEEREIELKTKNLKAQIDQL